MRFSTVRFREELALAVSDEAGLYVHAIDGRQYPALEKLCGAEDGEVREVYERIKSNGERAKYSEVHFLPPLMRPPKIVCVGLNYVDHTAESGFEQPGYPTLFGRFASSLVGHGQNLVRPASSEQFDYEGELAVIIGRRGRRITHDEALDHVFGYSIFNDASLRDFQFKSPQWTAGKNFDGTGAFGPEVVTKEELPAGCKGLTLETRLNGEVMQKAPIADMIFDVQSLIQILSDFMTLEVGDVIVSGTPSGVGMARTPPVWMKAGDTVEVGVSEIGTLTNKIVDEQ